MRSCVERNGVPQLAGGAGGGLCSRACIAELLSELKERFQVHACIPHKCLKRL